MNDRQTRMLVAISIALFVLWLAWKRSKMGSSAQSVADAAAAPNLGTPEASIASATTPGMVNQYWYMNGSNQPMATPESIAVSVSVNPWQALNQNYMPLFGFVGMAQ